MSENLQQVFSDFVRQTKDELASIDQKYPSDGFKEECLKYIEKLDIYKKFTESLIEKGSKYLDVIAHLNEELSKPDLDVTSTASSVTVADEKFSEDFDFLRKCVDKRVNLEEEAMSSLVHLEAFVETLVADKQKLLVENNDLRAQKNNLESGENIASSAIATLTKENEELKEIIQHNEEAMNFIPNESSTVNIVMDDNVRNELSDCMEKLESLQRQLNDKDKVITHLTNQLSTAPKSRDDPSKTSDSSSSESKDSSASQTDKPVRPKKHQRSRSDVSKSTSSSDSRTLTDNEKSDNEKLRLFRDAYKEMALILKEKYQQLREQRAKIAELMKRLEETARKEDELLELKDLNADLRNKNNKLTEELSKLRADPKVVDELKQQSENLSSEIEKMKGREVLLARKLSMQDEHIITFRGERENLIKINNEMLNSIAACKKELAKYNVE